MNLFADSFSVQVAILRRSLFAAALLCLSNALARGEDPAVQQALRPLTYNNPGLQVDLGVGLWAWPIPWDADGDGDYDLFVSCPDKPSNGIWYFENRSGDTAENKFPCFEPAVKISSTVHYVMPSYVQGKLRVLSPGFEYPDFIKQGLAQRTELPIAANFYRPRWKQTKGPGIRHNQWRYSDYDGDGKIDLIVGIEDWSEYGWDDAWSDKGEWENGPLHGFVFVFLNEGDNEQPVYSPASQLMVGGKPLDVYGCPSPNFTDFDGDGDLDLLCGEFLDGFTYFQNVGTRTAPRYAPGVRVGDSQGNPLGMDVQMIVPIAFDWDRDGDHDLIVGDEDGRVALVENLGQQTAQGTPIFNQPRYFQQRADELKCGALATPFAVDWDGDGDQDILSGNTGGYIEWFENLSGPKVENPTWGAPRRLQAGGKTFRVMAGPNGSIQGPAEAKWGYTTFTVADWDHDGLMDIVYNSIWGRIEWLKNVGSRTVPELAAPQPVTIDDGEAKSYPRWNWWKPSDDDLVTQWRTTPVVVDWNKDGLNDLVMLDSEGYLALYQRVEKEGSLQLDAPQRIFVGTNIQSTDSQHRRGKEESVVEGPLQLNRNAAGGSGRRKLCVTDWDHDGQWDLLVNSTSANLLKGLGQKEGKWLFEDLGPIVSQNIQGHTTSPCVVDFNGDGVPEFLGGAEDGRFYYLRR